MGSERAKQRGRWGCRPADQIRSAVRTRLKASSSSFAVGMGFLYCSSRATKPSKLTCNTDVER